MKKVIGLIIELSLILEALAGFLSGSPSPIDYVILSGSSFALLLVGCVWISEKIKIRKKMKEIRAARESDKHAE